MAFDQAGRDRPRRVEHGRGLALGVAARDLRRGADRGDPPVDACDRRVAEDPGTVEVGTGEGRGPRRRGQELRRGQDEEVTLHVGASREGYHVSGFTGGASAGPGHGSVGMVRRFFFAVSSASG